MGFKKSRKILALSLLLCSLNLNAQSAAAAKSSAVSPDRKPNIIFLLADDMGYGDLGVQGDAEARTPNIDRIAAGGVRFTNFYANHPVCAPSRAAMITGNYQHRLGFEFNPAGAGPNYGLAAGVETLPDRLKKQGYQTAMFGKWHMGYRPEMHPTLRGFDTFYGFLGGTHPYTGADGVTSLSTTDGEDAVTFRLQRGTAPTDMPAHLTEQLGQEAMNFIKANKAQPFYVHLAFNAPHVPMQTTQAYFDQFKHIQDGDRRIHLAMNAAMDDQIGRILALLKSEGLEDNTLVIFASDNGGPTHQNKSSNGPLSGEKTLLLEGGIRVPAMMQWKGKLPKGGVIESPAMGFDITATVLALADALPAKPLDGVDLMPWLTGKKTSAIHDALYWRAGEQGAVRQGDWKLLKNGDVWHLFNLAQDLGERHDQAQMQPQRMEAMRTLWSAWNQEMKPPAWKSVRQSDLDKEKSYADDIERAINGIAKQRKN